MKWRVFGIVVLATGLIYAGVRLVLPKSSPTTRQETQEKATGGNHPLQTKNPPGLISQAQAPSQTDVSPFATTVGEPKRTDLEKGHSAIPPKASAISAPTTQTYRHYDKNNWPPGATGYIYSKEKGYTWAYSDANLIPADRVLADQTDGQVIRSDTAEMYFGQVYPQTGDYIETPEGTRIPLSSAQDYARLKYGRAAGDSPAPTAMEQAWGNPGQAFALSPKETEEYLTNLKTDPYNVTQRILDWENGLKKVATAQYEIDKKNANSDPSLLQLAQATFNINVLRIETRANRFRSARDIINKQNNWDREKKLAAFNKVFVSNFDPGQPLNMPTPPTGIREAGTHRRVTFDEEEEDDSFRRWIHPNPDSIGGFQRHWGIEQIHLRPDLIGGYIGQCGSEPIHLRPDLIGGYRGQCGNEQIHLRPDLIGGYRGQYGSEQIHLRPDLIGGLQGTKEGYGN